MQTGLECEKRKRVEQTNFYFIQILMESSSKMSLIWKPGYRPIILFAPVYQQMEVPINLRARGDGGKYVMESATLLVD